MTKIRFIDFFPLKEGQIIEVGITLLELRKLMEEKLS